MRNADDAFAQHDDTQHDEGRRRGRHHGFGHAGPGHPFARRGGGPMGGRGESPFDRAGSDGRGGRGGRGFARQGFDGEGFEGRDGRGFDRQGGFGPRGGERPEGQSFDGHGFDDRERGRRGFGDDERGRGYGGRGGPRAGGFGGPFGGGPGFDEGFDGPFGGRGRGPRGGRGPGRGRRGDVRAAILALLAEEPMNGYGLIGAIADKSEGLWKPGAGSVYPALGLLEDEGLISPDVDGRKKVYSLTDEGRTYVAEHADEVNAPWERVARPHTAILDLRPELHQLGMALHQVTAAGDQAQVDAARGILEKARKDVYRLLAGDVPASAGTGDADATNQATAPDQA